MATGTGYTEPIITGEITEFEDFAKRCIRAFGAAFHQRDDSLDKEFEPQKVSDYHPKCIARIEGEMEQLENTSAESIIREKIDNLYKKKEKAKIEYEKDKEATERLLRMLEQAKQYKAPTTEHFGIQKFMIEQLEMSIDDWDGGVDSYWKNRIRQIDEQVVNLAQEDAEDIKATQMKELQRDLDNHKERYEEEIEKCARNNEWVEQFLDSLKVKEI